VGAPLFPDLAPASMPEAVEEAAAGHAGESTPDARDPTNKGNGRDPRH